VNRVALFAMVPLCYTSSGGTLNFLYLLTHSLTHCCLQSTAAVWSCLGFDKYCIRNISSNTGRRAIRSTFVFPHNCHRIKFY